MAKEFSRKQANPGVSATPADAAEAKGPIRQLRHELFHEVHFRGVARTSVSRLRESRYRASWPFSPSRACFPRSGKIPPCAGAPPLRFPARLHVCLRKLGAAGGVRAAGENFIFVQFIIFNTLKSCHQLTILFRTAANKNFLRGTGVAVQLKPENP